MPDTIPCQGPKFGFPCDREIDPRTCCRFEDDSPAHHEYKLCVLCCPNCYGRQGKGPIELLEQEIQPHG